MDLNNLQRLICHKTQPTNRVQVPTLTSKLPFLVFLTVFGIALVEITFSMRKCENLAWLTSSKDSITMNLGMSAGSFSESDSDSFRLFFFI